MAFDAPQVFTPEFLDKDKYVFTNGRYQRLNDMTAGQQSNVSSWSALAFPQDVKEIGNICDDGELKWFPWAQIARDAVEERRQRLCRRSLSPSFPSPVVEMIMMFCD